MKEWVCFTFPYHCSSLNEVKAGTLSNRAGTWRQGLMQRARMGAAHSLASHDMLSLHFVEPSTTSPKVAPPTKSSGWITWRHFPN